MSNHSETDYAVLGRDLAQSLLVTIDRFAASRGLAPLKMNELSQMTTPFNETVDELLRFGCDAWQKLDEVGVAECALALVA